MSKRVVSPSRRPSDVPESATAGPSNTKRRKNIAIIACQRCRSKKQACDGRKPSCSKCAKFKLICQYDQDLLEDETRQAAIKREAETSKQRLAELSRAAEYLQKASAEEADEALALIRNAQNPLEALQSLSKPLRPSRAPSNSDQAVDGELPKATSKLAYDLSIRHRGSYPMLVPVDSALLSVGFGQGAPSASSRPSGPQLSFRHPPGQPDPGSRDVPSFYRHSSNDAAISEGNLTLSLQPFSFVDERLLVIDMRLWTNVPIANDLAATMISHYMRIDHPILGWFDAQLFIASLSSGYPEFCSSFLVNALFYWICQGYNAINDESTIELGHQFLAEAEERWRDVAKGPENVLDVAACMILSISLAMEGRDKLATFYRTTGAAMGARFRLYDDPNSVHDIGPDNASSANEYRCRSHIAWGAYNWLCLHAAYHGEVPPKIVPHLHIPTDGVTYMGHTFQGVCRFRVIISDMMAVYNLEGGGPVFGRVPLSFAENIFHRLLDWVDDFDAKQRRIRHITHHVSTLHIWYHTAVLDLFRPFVSRNLRLQTFTAVDSTPEAVYEASLSQLKCLVVAHLQTHESARYSILWHFALLAIGNDIISPDPAADALFYWHYCVESYIELYKSYRIAAGFLGGLVVMAVRRGFIGATDARAILKRLSDKAREMRVSERLGSGHTMDFQLALTDGHKARLDELIKGVEELTVVDDVGGTRARGA